MAGLFYLGHTLNEKNRHYSHSNVSTYNLTLSVSMFGIEYMCLAAIVFHTKRQNQFITTSTFMIKYETHSIEGLHQSHPHSLGSCHKDASS